MNHQRKNHAKFLRIFRKIHRWTGLTLFLFFLFIALTGILLGWKKNSGGLLLPKVENGTTSDLKAWLPIDKLHLIACQVLQDSISPNISLNLDRIDIRKDKGVVRFVFQDHYWGVQLDGSTGKLLNLELRRSDFVENIHDGSILDFYFGTKNVFKLIYTSIMGSALLIFIITGLWLWYGPKYMRKKLN